MATSHANRFRRLVRSLALAAAALGPSAAAAAAGQGGDGAAPAFTPHVVGAEVRVTDVAAAIGFYRDLLGFDVVTDAHLPELAVLRNGTVELTLRRAERPAAIDYPRQAETHVNLEIESLPRTLEALRAAGVSPVVDAPVKAQVGEYLVVRDPAGNLLHLMDLASRNDPLPRPRVFNIGVKVTDMKAAREFYVGALGLEVFSEDYYPPALPLQRAGEVALVLHESAETAADAGYPAAAHTEVVFAVADLEAAARALAARGVRVLDEVPRTSPTGAYIAIADPDGHVHQLRQSAAPAAAAGGAAHGQGDEHEHGP